MTGWAPGGMPGAAETARRIRSRDLSPVEAVEAALRRIEAVNPVLNAFCFVYPDAALEAARAAERMVAEGRPLGPLHGVPVAVKDMTPTRGRRTTLGSHVFTGWIPDHDAVVVERLRAAGAILVGKTTTPEFAHAGTTESPLWGVTRNPWSPDHTPGGSSGGSGAAVASGCVPLAEGSDMGGSVRIPAACCGLVGLKPSHGRIPMDLLETGFDTLSHIGPLARTVEDAALFLSAVEGPDERDPLSQVLPLPLGSWPPEGAGGLRLALSVDLGFYRVEPGVEANLRAAADALRAAGAEVEEVEVGWTRALEDAWEVYWAVFQAALFGEHLEAWRESMDPGVVAYIEAGLQVDAVSYKRLEILRSRAWRSLAGILGRYDALLCPTLTRGVPRIGGSPAEPGPDGLSSSTMTGPFNLFGQCPVLAVPTGTDAAGLPTSMQVVGRRFDDPTVLRIGHALERLLPWGGPPGLPPSPPPS
jgi:Asp-tRNA(Asn)/Glu-tRNA(Gln) amidotransferase A subunit family amidase